MIRVAILRANVLLSAILVTTAAGVRAQVRVDIGIHLPAPPAFVVIPGMPVYYAPQTPENVFFYGHQYWGKRSRGQRTTSYRRTSSERSDRFHLPEQTQRNFML